MRSQQAADYPGCPATILAAESSGEPLVPTSWGVVDAVIAGVGAFIISVLVAISLYSVGLVGTGIGLLLAAMIPWIAMAGWPLWATSRYGNGPVRDLGLRLTWSDFGVGVGAGLLALVLGSIAAYLTTLVVGDFESAAGDAANEVAASGGYWALIGFAALVVVGAPFVEELLFRGMLWAGLRRRGWSALATGVTTTAAFALFHFEITRLVVLFVIGGVLAVVRYRTEALGACMTAHAVNNLPGAIAILALT
jgi:membrane protease YdiL (CAAX protease family)